MSGEAFGREASEKSGSLPNPGSLTTSPTTPLGEATRALLKEEADAPSAADKRAYIRLDREPPGFVDRVMLRRLADGDRLPDKRPDLPQYGAPNPKAPSRAALIAFWKGRYGA